MAGISALRPEFKDLNQNTKCSVEVAQRYWIITHWRHAKSFSRFLLDILWAIYSTQLSLTGCLLQPCLGDVFCHFPFFPPSILWANREKFRENLTPNIRELSQFLVYAWKLRFNCQYCCFLLKFRLTKDVGNFTHHAFKFASLCS